MVQYEISPLAAPDFDRILDYTLALFTVKGIIYSRWSELGYLF